MKACPWHAKQTMGFCEHVLGHVSRLPHRCKLLFFREWLVFLFENT